MALFRGEEATVRKGLVLSDKIEAIIGLGPNLFYNAPMEACVLICNNRKDESKKNKVIFINAIKEVTRKNAESYLEPAHITKILDAYHSSEDVSNFMRLVDVEEIEKNNFDLSIQKYVFINEITTEVLTLENAKEKWLTSHNEMIQEYDNLLSMMKDGVQI